MIERYPNLAKDIQEAPLIRIKGRDGLRYSFRVFSFGERGSSLDIELTKEIVKGLSEKMGEFRKRNPFDYFTGIFPGGNTWTPLLTHVSGIPSRLTWSTHLKPKDYRELGIKEIKINALGPHGRNLYFRGHESGDKIALLDDVISTGETLKAAIRSIKDKGIVIVGVFAIVTKGDNYKKIGETEGIPIIALKHLTKTGRLIKY